MSAGLASSTSLNSGDLKRQLIDCVKQEKADFMVIAKEFYRNSQRTKEDYLALTDAIIGAVDHVLAQNDWEESLFLRNAIKPLKQIREEAIALKQQATMTLADQQVALRDLDHDEMLVYI